MVPIRMKSFGRRHRPFFRICAMDARSPRDGKAIEELGHHDPMVRNVEARTVLNVNRIRYWLSVGAQPSEPVQRILEKTGDWQKFKGLPAPEPLKVAPARTDRRARYEAEAQAAAGVAPAETKPARKAAKKAAAAEAPAAETQTEESAGADAGTQG